MQSTIPHDVEMLAEVNAPQLVTLYDRDGETIQVESGKVEKWLARGFSQKKTDLDAILSEFDAAVSALYTPWADYLMETREKGYIPVGAQEAAHVALNMVAEAANRLHLGIHDAFNPEGE